MNEENRPIITLDIVLGRIQNYCYSIGYAEAIELSKYTEVQYMWNKTRDGTPHLAKIKLKQIDGLLLEVIH